MFPYFYVGYVPMLEVFVALVASGISFLLPSLLFWLGNNLFIFSEDPWELSMIAASVSV